MVLISSAVLANCGSHALCNPIRLFFPDGLSRFAHPFMCSIQGSVQVVQSSRLEHMWFFLVAALAQLSFSSRNKRSPGAEKNPVLEPPPGNLRCKDLHWSHSDDLLRTPLIIYAGFARYSHDFLLSFDNGIAGRPSMVVGRTHSTNGSTGRRCNLPAQREGR